MEQSSTGQRVGGGGGGGGGVLTDNEERYSNRF
jgi:hypothetical protein